MIRLFQFKNNFLSENSGMLDAEYSVIGYFDGLDMKTDKEENVTKHIELLSDPMRIDNVQELNEMCDCFNIAGIRQKDDAEFWEEKAPFFVFISCLRLQRRSDVLQRIMETIESYYVAVCYTTLDSSDLVVCLKTKRYDDGYKAIENYHRIIREIDEHNDLQKGFSVLAIRQEALNVLKKCRKTWMEEEILNCVLRIVIKDWREVNNYLEKLKKTLNSRKYEINGILGSEDIMVIFNNVRSSDWFRLYADNGLMTHGNSYYDKAFYNIRTEILIRREDGDIS